MKDRIIAAIRDPRFVLGLALIAVLRIVSGSNLVFIYLLSYAFHGVNLAAYLFRRYSFASFIWHSLAARTIAFAVLGAMMWPYLDTPINLYALIPLGVGFVLHSAAVRALGMKRTYFAVELGELPPKKITTFPYGVIPHPMELGAMLQFVGLYLLLPAFSQDYPWLIPGHLVLSAVTALVEHYNWHFEDSRFQAVVGRFDDRETRQTIDQLRDWSLDHYREHLNRECSLHEYIKTLPEDVVSEMDKLRYSEPVMNALREAFPGGTVVPMSMTDEVYVSRYNFDGGGDQGLFDKHYDGNLRYLPGASMVRSLIYLSSDDHLKVVFDTSGEKANMKTYDFGMLDFHKELHWVEGSYDPKSPPRVLLKCNYYIDHTGFAPYRQMGIWANLGVFYTVRAAMEYSKSPRTWIQRQIGRACNFFRVVNNVNAAAPVALGLMILAVSLRLLFDAAF